MRRPSAIELDHAAQTLDVAIEGISVPKPHTGLRDAIVATLIGMINDGKYMEILTKYGDQSGAITAADVVVNKH